MIIGRNETKRRKYKKNGLYQFLALQIGQTEFFSNWLETCMLGRLNQRDLIQRKRVRMLRDHHEIVEDLIRVLRFWSALNWLKLRKQTWFYSFVTSDFFSFFRQENAILKKMVVSIRDTPNRPNKIFLQLTWNLHGR